MDFTDIDKQFQAMESDSKVTAARAAKQTCQCANLDERWLCLDCDHCWFGTLHRTGCPNCGADIDRIDMRNDLAVDHQGTKQ